MSSPKPVFAEAAVAAPAGQVLMEATHAGEATAGAGLKAWMLTLALFLVPLATYWPTTFHDYGLRDDYSNLRESQQEPGKVLQFCASHARPLYGLLLQASYGEAGSVQNLQWLRFSASLLLGAISVVMLRALRALGWSFNTSLCLALLLALTPSAQVIASWAVGWPYALTALLSVAAFFSVEGALGAGIERAPPRRAGQWALGLALMLVSTLIYQPSAMFYLVPMAAALIGRRRATAGQAARWLGAHLGVVLGTLALAYAVMNLMYAAHWFVKSGRIAFESHWGEKLAWFLREPLPNALSLFVLNDDHGRDHALYVACASLAALILLAGTWVEWRRHGRDRGLVWLAGLAILPPLAFLISLVAAERYATYRTIFALTAVLLCFLVASARTLTEGFGTQGRKILAALTLVIGLYAAQHHAYALIAVPQGNEWQMVVSGARHVHLGAARPRIFAIASRPQDISTATIYHDEFGSLSSNSEWVPREMFKRAMHDLHPELTRLDSRYDFATGPVLPAGRHYDVIIDLRRLRQFYTDN